MACRARRVVGEGLCVFGQGASGMRPRACPDCFLGTCTDQLTAALTPFRAEVDDPVCCAHDIEIVFDDHQTVPGSQQLVEGAEQSGYVIEMQAGGGFVKQEELALGTAAACPQIGQVSGELQALCFTAR